ncbi:SusC/RagA family TonB-linked outer membrane protein [Pedobacter xixiisoli]|uniref:TonB-linked outer membrane protein, SusC/RagA family n=1 Tax=Pedobacter xixiisoli TaxID=1476464 RepID=A0A286ADS1_9SPHI|nr:TonB-dependent receptor [Pedobacter xixiisoli]SOD20048.1 TonB-linked outer membrane protein, SusC/RagA family [Pedobacter xixiisoli]
MKKLLQSLFILLFVATSAIAQNRTITGTVTSKEDGLPIPGVSVKVKGTNVGVSTGANGKFSLSVPANATALEFSSIGFGSQTVTIGSSTTINVSISPDSKDLTEVVVTGYGVTRKKDFTGAASSVKGDDLKDRPVQSFTQGLTGQAAGVSIVQPNGVLNNPPVIRVRGVSSISLSSFPLVIVDGIPFPTGDVSPNSAANNPLGDINPADIESIDILKDAASTALYGSRAAAGVLVITTKKGKTGDAKVTYDGWFGTTKAVRLPELLSAEQYVDSKNIALKNALVLNPNVVPAAQRDANGNGFFLAYNPDGSVVRTNWYDEVYRTAMSQNHSVTLSGGSAKTTYFVSGGLSDQDGFIRANNFKRYSGRGNFTHKATDWLELNLNLAYTNSVNNSPNSGSVPGAAFNSSGLGRIAIAAAPNVGVLNAAGTDYNLSGQYLGAYANLVPSTWANPRVIVEKDRNTSESTRFLTNLGATFKIVEGLTFRTNYSWDRSNTENIQFWNPRSGDGFTNGGLAANNNQRRNNWNWINTLSYNKTFGGDHNLNLTVGSDVQKTRTDNWGATRTNLGDPTFFDQFQGTFVTNTPSGNGISEFAIESYLASASYNYKSRYFISGNFRRDGNSGLAFENRWGNFGGGSIGWAVAQEDFFKNSSLAKTVSTLRLRASYGKVGNGNVGAYNEFTTYSPALYGAIPFAWVFNQAGNRELRWEVTSQVDIGLNLGFLNDRITFEADYFKKTVNDLLINVPQAPSKGIPGGTILANVGGMYNKGFEFTLAGNPVKTAKFNWTTSLNLTTIKNEVTALDPNVTQIISSTGGLESASVTKPGYSIGSIYAVKTAGVNPDNGRRIFINAAGREVQYQHFGGTSAWTYLDGTQAAAVSGDAQVIANTLPKWYGGFNNTFTYGNFDLNVMFTYSGGNYIYNGTRSGLLDQRFWNNSTEILNAWTAAGQQTDIPRRVYGDNVSNGSSFAIDANVEKGDFLRLQVATLGYKVPRTLFGKTGLNSLRVYASVNNAFIITGYTGVDPEISTNGNSNTSAGIERNSVPQGRTFTFGLSLGL